MARLRSWLVLLLGSALMTAHAKSPQPLCAVGDFHGDTNHAYDALRMCGAVDSYGRWIGGRMTVVQTGDVVDRGNASMVLLHSLWALQAEAAAAGGELVLLMGNHDLLNMQGMVRYVHRGELDRFGGSAAWLHAMDPQHGEIGKRLAAQPGVAVRGEGACRTLFLHAGLRLRTATTYSSLEDLNAELTRQTRDEPRSGELLDARDGPLWWRGYARPHAASLSEDESCAEARAAIDKLGDGAARMTVGHNIVPFVSTRCEGALHMIDVGMSYAYEGRPAAWRCALDETTGKAKIRALYERGEEHPPDLCTACAEVLGSVRGGRHAHPPLRGMDPHGDCRNYCNGSPSRRVKSGGGGGAGLSSFFGSWAVPPEASSSGAANHVKTEF